MERDLAAHTTALETADAAKWVNRQEHCLTQPRATISMGMSTGPCGRPTMQAAERCLGPLPHWKRQSGGWDTPGFFLRGVPSKRQCPTQRVVGRPVYFCDGSWKLTWPVGSALTAAGGQLCKLCPRTGSDSCNPRESQGELALGLVCAGSSVRAPSRRALRRRATPGTSRRPKSIAHPCPRPTSYPNSRIRSGSAA